MEEECYQESFSTIKERMLNTNEIIMMVKNTCSKYQRVVEACKKIKNELSESTLKIHGLTLDNDRLNLLLQKAKLSNDKLEEENKSLSADKLALGEGYNKYMVQSQMAIRELEDKLKMSVLKPPRKIVCKTKTESLHLTKAMERKIRSLNVLLRKETAKTKITAHRYRQMKARLKIKADISKTQSVSGPPINSIGVQTESDNENVKSAKIIEVGVQTENSENCDNCSVRNILEEFKSYPSLLSPMADDTSTIDLNMIPPDDTEHDYTYDSSSCLDSLPLPPKNQDFEEVVPVFKRSTREVPSRGNGVFEMKYMRLKNRLKKFTRNLHLKYQRNLLEGLIGLQKHRNNYSKKTKRRKNASKNISDPRNLNATYNFERSRNLISCNSSQDCYDHTCDKYKSLKTVLNSSRLAARFASNPSVPDSAINTPKNYEEEAFLNKLVDFVSQRLQNEGFEKKDPANRTLDNSGPRFESKGCQNDPTSQLATVDVATNTCIDPCSQNKISDSRTDLEKADQKTTELEVISKGTEQIERQCSVTVVFLPENQNKMSPIMNVTDIDSELTENIKLQETVPENQLLSVTKIPDPASGFISIPNQTENPELKVAQSKANIHVNVQTKDNSDGMHDMKSTMKILNVTFVTPINCTINKRNRQLCKISQENNNVFNNIDKLIKAALYNNHTLPLLRVVHIHLDLVELAREAKFQSASQTQINDFNKYYKKSETMTAGNTYLKAISNYFRLTCKALPEKTSKRKYSLPETSSFQAKKLKSELPESKATVQTNILTEKESNFNHDEQRECKILDVKPLNFSNSKPNGQPSAFNTVQDVQILLKNDLASYPEIGSPLSNPMSPQCVEDSGENCSDVNVKIIPNKQEEMREIDESLLNNDVSISSKEVDLDTGDLLELDNFDEEYLKSYLDFDVPLLSPMSPQCEDDEENCLDTSIKIIPNKNEEMIDIDESISKPKCPSSSKHIKAKTLPKTHLQRKLMQVVKLKKKMLFPLSQNTCKIKEQNVNKISSQKRLVIKKSIQGNNLTSTSSNFHSERNNEDNVIEQQSVSPRNLHARSRKPRQDTNSLLTPLNECNQVKKRKKAIKKVSCMANSPEIKKSEKNTEGDPVNLDILSKIMSQMDRGKPIIKPIRENKSYTWIDDSAYKRRMLDLMPILREKADLTQDLYPNWFEECVKRKKFKGTDKTRHMTGLLEKIMRADIETLVELEHLPVTDLVKMILQKLSTNSNYRLPAKLESQVLTPVQHCFMNLMVHHEKKYGSNIGQVFLEEVEKEIWTNICTLRGAVSITRLYTTVCRLRGEVVRIRNYFCAAFLRRKFLCIPILYAVLTTWPDVFPKEPEWESFSPSKVIVYSVHKQKDLPSNRVSLYGLKKLLTTYYQYNVATWDDEKMCEDLFKDYYNEPTFSKEYALQVFFKSQPREFLSCKLNEMFKPLVYRILNPEHLSRVILLMGRLCRIADYPLTLQQKSELCQCLLNYATDMTPPIVKMSIQLSVEVLMRPYCKKIE